MDLKDIVFDHLRTDISLDGPLCIRKIMVHPWSFEVPRPKFVRRDLTEVILMGGWSQKEEELMIVVVAREIHFGIWRGYLDRNKRPLFECPAVMSDKKPLRAEDPKCIGKLDKHIMKFFFPKKRKSKKYNDN